MTERPTKPATETIETAIGSAIRAMREDRQLSARALAEQSGVSAAMISRIESGQVSPSIATMTALCDALDVPLAALFQRTAPGHADSTHVKRGEGLRSVRRLNNYEHEFVNLAFHRRVDLQFEARRVTVARQDSPPPVYSGSGVVFIYVVEGAMTYMHGDRDFPLEAGDSLSLDAELAHGIRSVDAPQVTFLVVQGERR